MEKPNIEICSNKEYSNWYWSEFNEVCISCQKECKQSHVVKVTCPNRKEIK